MYSMFARIDMHPQSDFGEFVAYIGNNPDNVKAAENIARRLHPLYSAWGKRDSAAIATLQQALSTGRPSIYTDQEEVIREKLKTYLFGSVQRIAFLNRMIVSLQNDGREVTILTKGIGACVVSALRAFLPNWLLEEDGCTFKGMIAAQECHLCRPVVVVDYAGLMWYRGQVSHAAAPCSNKLLQIITLLPQLPYRISVIEKKEEIAGIDSGRKDQGEIEAVFTSQDPVPNHSAKALLVDDSASGELKGLGPRKITQGASSSTSTCVFRQVNLPIPKELLEHSGGASSSAAACGGVSRETVGWTTGTELHCIAGGPTHNGHGLQESDLGEVLRLASV